MEKRHLHLHLKEKSYRSVPISEVEYIDVKDDVVVFHYYFNGKLTTQAVTRSLKYYAANIGLKIFPNPSMNILNVSINISEPIVITIFDVTSKQLLQKIFTNSASLNIENLSAGVYLYRLESGERIIKQGKILKSDN